MNFTPQLLVGLGFGAFSSEALAFDVLGGDAFELAKRQGQINGLIRLGPRERGDKTPDKRPFCLAPNAAASPTANVATLWNRTRGGAGNDAFLKTRTGALGGADSIWFENNSFPNIWEYTSPAIISTNEGWGLRAYVSDVSKASGEGSAKGHVVYARIGVAGRGWKLQIKDGNIEMLHLSRDWNATEEANLHQLWQLNEPTPEEIAETQRLESLLYDVSEGLSFEGGLGRDEWRGAGWAMLFLPEPRGVNQLPAGMVERGFYDRLTSYTTGNIAFFGNSRWEALDDVLGVEPGSDDTKWRLLLGNASNSKPGALHFLLEGGAGAVLDLAESEFLDSDGIAHPPTGDLWRNTAVSIGATGGEVGWQILNVSYNSEGTGEWGWFGSETDTTTFTDLRTSVYATGPGKDEDGNYYTSAKLEKLDDERTTEGGDPQPLPSLRFKLKITLSTTDSRYTPIVHAVSARKPNGARENANDSTVLTDTLALAHDDQPVMSMGLNCDESGARSVDFTLRNVNGRTRENKTLEDFVGHMATFKLGGEPWLTNGSIIRGRDNDLRQLAQTIEDGPLLRTSYATAKGESNFELTLDDGRWLSSERLCNPSLILDGLFLGQALRELERAEGRAPHEYALIPPVIGPRIPEREAGDTWCYVVEKGTSIDGARQGLLDRFGFGLRYRRNALGVAVLEAPPTVPKYAFTSNGLLNDPDDVRGGTRHIILNSLVWQIDLDNYHTIFSVKGRGVSTRFVNRAAVKLLPGNIAGPRFRGSHKEYPEFVDEGIRDKATANYVLQSLEWRYGRPGRIAQVQSYLHPDLTAWDRSTFDGVLAEVVSWDGEISSGEKPRMQMPVREVI